MKADEHRYIDKDKTKLRTANNLYDTAIQIIDGIKNKDIVDKIPEAYKLACSDLLGSLAFGKGEAAYALAALYKEGLGVKADEYKSSLFFYISKKLENETYKISSSQVEAEANNWVKTIKEIKKKYPNKDAEITYDMTIEITGKIKRISENSKDILEETSSHISDVTHPSKTADTLYDNFTKKVQPIIEATKIIIQNKKKLTTPEHKDLLLELTPEHQDLLLELTPEHQDLLLELFPDAMLALMHGKKEVLTKLVPIYATLAQETTTLTQETIYYHLLNAIRKELGMSAHSKGPKPTEELKKIIDPEAKKLASYIKLHTDTTQEIDIKMESEANNMLKYFHNDSMMKHFSSDDVYQDSNYSALQLDNDYQDYLPEVKASGEGSHSCCKIF